jgi:hypothetical protein
VPPLPPGTTYVAIDAGNRHSVALRSDGQVSAWGENQWGQCNVLPIGGGLTYVEIDASVNHTLARRSDGSVVAWGYDSFYGHLTVPGLPPGLEYVETAAGNNQSVARYTTDAPGPFCTAKANLACGSPQVSSSGVPSATATSGFVVRAGPARSCKSGILLYNTSSVVPGVPFHGGTLCVTPSGLRRAGPTSSQGSPGGLACDGVFALDMSAFAASAWNVPDCAGKPSGLAPNAPAGFLTSPGQNVSCQLWGRDTVATGSFLSAGLRYIVTP